MTDWVSQAINLKTSEQKNRRGFLRGGKASGFDHAVTAGVLGIAGKRFVGEEGEIAFDAKAEGAFHAFKLGEPDGAKLGKAHPQIAKPEGNVLIQGIELVG